MIPVNLNDREIEFLRLCVEDLTYAEIADIMCLGVRTIDWYAENLRLRLDVKSRVGLIRFSVSNGIGEIPVRQSFGISE